MVSDKTQHVDMRSLGNHRFTTDTFGKLRLGFFRQAETAPMDGLQSQQPFSISRPLMRRLGLCLNALDIIQGKLKALA
jgi:hypothetical protein